MGVRETKAVRSPEQIVHGGGGGLGGGGTGHSSTPHPAQAPAQASDHGPVAGQAIAGTKIVLNEQRLGANVGRHEDAWKRKPNTTGTGAIHVKSFHCKLNSESLDYLDRQINEWLDAHPQYEVKFVTTSIGEWQGKIKEPNLIMQVWV
ncbi:MAG: hypothetical protein SFY95_01890 [Planctomycetota bacterium]|nr:hypothetical protein [Planctomycetota bacterium]